MRVFAVGLLSGVALLRWRPVLKGSIRLAVKGGVELRRLAVLGAENVSDIAREALDEIESAKDDSTN